MKARVIVTLLADIPDSHGETVAQAIADAGYDSVTSVRQGKVLDFEIEAEDQTAAHSMLVKISRDVLADLESEDFLVRVEAPAEEGQANRRRDERRDHDRRDEDNRRSGRDRRDDAAAARGEERREGTDRRGDATPYDRTEKRSGHRRSSERRSDNE